MAKRPCLDCGTPTETTRCPTCTSQNRSQADRYRSTRAWTNHSRTLIAAHVAANGWNCPGIHDELSDHPPHPSTDLTTEHLDKLHNAGRDTGRHQVLCRSENSRRGNLT